MVAHLGCRADTVIMLLHDTIIMSLREHKLDRLKSDSKGAANRHRKQAQYVHRAGWEWLRTKIRVIPSIMDSILCSPMPAISRSHIRASRQSASLDAADLDRGIKLRSPSVRMGVSAFWIFPGLYWSS